MPQIECSTLSGEPHFVSAEELIFRPSVYGVTKHEGKVLLIRTTAAGAYEFPGGGVDLGERMETALRREFVEEAGIEVEVGRLLLFKENFFYREKKKQAYQSLLFAYECTPLQTVLPEAHPDIDGVETEEPVWIDPAGLEADDFVGTDRDFFMELRGLGLL